MVADRSDGDGLSLTGSKLVTLIRAVHEKGADFRMTARGWSMYPSIHDGDIITISPFRDLPPYPGEVVAFIRPRGEKLVVHRVLRKIQGAYIIKGDNLPEPDGNIPAACLLGVVTRVERGNITLFWPDRFNHRLLAQLYFSLFPAVSRWYRPFKKGLFGFASRIVYFGRKSS